MSACEAPGATSVRVALKLPFPAAEVACYILRTEVLAYWMGRHCELGWDSPPSVCLPYWRLTDQGPPRFDALRSGSTRKFDWPVDLEAVAPEDGNFELVVSLDPSPRQTQAPPADADPAVSSAAPPAPEEVAFRLSACSSLSCRLRIQHSGLADPEARRASVRLWQGALRRLGRLMKQALRSHRHDRQAIILVHGIGEQRPGQLLRDFVSNVFETRELYYVKPDHVSSLFEMRTATVPRMDDKRPTTDVYELYWAHLIRDTTLPQVYGWILRLVLSKDRKIPQTLVRVVWLVRLALVAGLGIFAWVSTKDVSGWLKALAGGAFVAVPGLLSLGIKSLRDKFVIGFAGDAARYLEPRPENIARRQQVREAGARLLDALHKKRRYERIVVYAHSLGSVIAYDILSHAWARNSRARDPVPDTSSRALRALEDLVNPHSCPSPAPGLDEIQAMQHEAWREYRRNGFQWRVSDFVTVGSPLAHARWLLDLDARTQFDDLVRERSYPTCPPVTEKIAGPAPNSERKVFTFTHAYVDPYNHRARRSVQVPHHGGLFALTRWTNLFFPYRGLLDGDPVAGPLAPCFGQWVRDVELRASSRGFAHSRYTARDLEPEAVARVREALNLPMRRPLSEHAPASLQPTVLE